MTDYAEHDALGLAALVRAGTVTPEDLLEEALRRTAQLDARLNAVVTDMAAEARRLVRAGLPDGPFRGVPFLLKDIQHAYAGVPLAAGSAALRAAVPTDHSAVVRRFLAAGLVPFGKTNVPELALMGVTEPEAFGPTRNPWDLDRNPGGSSGGSAAAVAARIAPLASANDGGGSIRIPAAWCGLFGLKPSRGRVPVGPQLGEAWDGASCDGVLSRSVRDTAAALDVLAGPDAGAPYWLPPPEAPYLQQIERPPDALRVGFCVRSPLGGPVDPECVRAVEGAARLLEGLGHRVEEAEPEIDGHALARCYLTMYMGQTAAALAEMEAEVGTAAVRAGTELETRALALLGRSLPAGEYVRAKREWNTFARAMGRFHERFDLYSTPTTASLPPAIGALKLRGAERAALRTATTLRLGTVLLKAGLIDRLAEENLAPVPFTQLANLTGQPAMSVPLHWTEGGLPCGVQFIAPLGQEGRLLRLAAQLEGAQPWADRRPPPIR
ncbi:MAG: amidase [Rhodothermales bacterium]|nr:amidase [Rhodothermales bacterium]